MSREIKCTVCRKSMGIIRDASLRQGIRYICTPCDNRRLEIMVEFFKRKNEPQSTFEKMFGGKGIFNQY